MRTKFFFTVIICFGFLTGLNPSYAEGFEIDMPDFSNAGAAFRAKGAQALESAQGMADKTSRFGKESKEKLIELRKAAGSKVLNATGRPTDHNLKAMPRKTREKLLEDSCGYYGVLPNIEREFNYLRKSNGSTNQGGKYSNSLEEENLKKAPIADDLFLDIILKKKKDTQYIKDVLKISSALERFRDCIDRSCDIQQFNANVNLIDLYAKRLEKDYENKPESANQSYYMIRNVAYLAKLQGNLKYDANYYSKYMPLQNTVYSKENIDKKEQELLHEINKTIFELKQFK